MRSCSVGDPITWMPHYPVPFSQSGVDLDRPIVAGANLNGHRLGAPAVVGKDGPLIAFSGLNAYPTGQASGALLMVRWKTTR